MYPSSSPYSVYLIALVVVGEVAVSNPPDEVGGLKGAAQDAFMIFPVLCVPNRPMGHREGARLHLFR